MRYWLLAALAVGLWCSAAQAAPRVEQVYGGTIGSAHMQRQWVSVFVKVRNEGDAAEGARAVLHVSSGLREVQYVKAFHLPAGCERRVCLYAQLGSDNSYPVEVLDRRGSVLGKGEVWTSPLTRGRFLILVLDEAALLPNLNLYLSQWDGYGRLPGDRSATLVETQRLPELMAGIVRRGAVMHTRVGDFPDYWAGLDSLNAVALGQVDHQQWRPGQLEALTTWLQSGGTLLLFPGTELDSLRASRFESLLPVRIYGSRKLDHLPLEDDLNRWEVPLADYVDVLEAEVRDGETLLRSRQMPMVVRKQVGMGAICFFAMPGEALDQWKQRGPLLAHILRGRERIKPFSQSELVGNGPRMLDDVAGAQAAPPSFVVATLGGFFLVAAVSLVVAHWKGRGELAWAAIIPTGIIVAALSYRAGATYRKRVGLSLNEIAVAATGSGSGRVFRSGVVGIHADRDLAGELVAEDPNTLFTTSAPAMGEGGEIARDFVDVGPPFSLTSLRISAGSFPRYVVDSVLELSGNVTADLQLGENGITGRITNSTPMQLEQCLCAVNSYPYVIGNLAPGQSVEVALSDANVKSKDDFTTESVLGSRSRTRKQIIASLFKMGEGLGVVPWAQRLFVMGWPDRGFICEGFVGVHRDLTRRSIALLCVEASVRPAAPGERVCLPRAFSTPALWPEGALTIMDLVPFITTMMPERTTLYFYLPEFTSNVEITEATVDISAGAYGYRLGIVGRDQQTGREVELGSWENLDSRQSLTIPQAGRFQDKNMRALVLELRAVQLAKMGQAPSVSTQGWTLRDVSVALKGVAR